MKFIESLKEGMHISEVYLCKTKMIAMSKTGKEYASLSLQDKTGSIDAKIWDLYSYHLAVFQFINQALVS